VAAVVAGIYFLYKAFDDTTQKTVESIGRINDYIGTYKELFKAIQDNSAKLADTHMQMLVSTGKMTQKEYDLWKLSEQKKQDLKLNFANRAAALFDLQARTDIEREGKKGDALIAIEKASNTRRLQIIADFGKNAALITSNYDEAVKKTIADDDKKTASANKQKGAYDQLTAKISEQEEKIKNILALGGTVSPEMLAKLYQYEKQLDKVNKAFEKVSKAPLDRVANVDVVMSGSSSIPEIKSGKDKYGIEQKAFIENLKKRHEVSNKYNQMELSDAAKAAKAIQDIETQKNKTNLQTTADTFGGIASIFKENTIAYKVMASGQAVINAFLAASAAAASAAAIPIIGAVMSPIAYASALAQGFMAVAGINGVAFAGGGIVPGGSYSGDNIPARLNSGEMILNGMQQSKLFALANGSGVGGGGNVRFEIEGTKLVGVLSNHSRKINNTR